MTFSRFFLIPASLALAAGDLLAQATGAPDAGALRQQIEQQRDLPLPPAVRPQRSAPTAAARPPAGATVTVRSFRFAGNTLLSAAQLAPAVNSFLQRPLGFEDLQRAADAVAAVYREAGWVVRVFLPEQDISEGVVTLQVVEARFAGVRFEGEASRRVRQAEIEAYFKAAQAQGQPLHADGLDRALLLADDLPGVSVAGTLVPGQAEGETALALQTTDEPFIYGDAGVDNTGARSTGSRRVTANLNVTSPGGRGELLVMNLLRTRGSQYGRVALTVPAGDHGLRVGVSASAMTYEVIDGPGAATAARIRGRSASLGLDANYPLLRTRMHNLYLSGSLEEKTFRTSDTQVRSDYASDSLRLGLSGNRFDELGGGGANSASAQVVRGRLTQMAAHSQLDTIPRSYRKLTYSLSRQQTVTADHSLFVSLAGQQATQVLDSSEKFYIGGAGSVRAYPASELGGERGQVASAEWRWRLHPDLTLSAFVEVGRVVTLATNAYEQDTALRLHGRGLSLAWQAPLGVSARVTWAHRNGANPKPTLTGTDGDGTLKKNRVWLVASGPF